MLDATSVLDLDNEFCWKSKNKVAYSVQFSKDEEQKFWEYLSEYFGKRCPEMRAHKYATEQSKKYNERSNTETGTQLSKKHC